MGEAITVGLDIAKHVFQVLGLDEHSEAVDEPPTVQPVSM